MQTIVHKTFLKSAHVLIQYKRDVYFSTRQASSCISRHCSFKIEPQLINFSWLILIIVWPIGSLCVIMIF